ncbi:hypothetical protein HMPREF1317_0315 [Schaalia georgiae F0490]|uniref:Uncharacterized protein n=1 Tax=Schaalia georgiae F0490 TaxID=1125717 RepID=J0MUS3_9ACTO|nr:hypothetical protein HMPREF1317_0315 [Schaalia georgiae F0490]
MTTAIRGRTPCLAAAECLAGEVAKRRSGSHATRRFRRSSVLENLTTKAPGWVVLQALHRIGAGNGALG